MFTHIHTCCSYLLSFIFGIRCCQVYVSLVTNSCIRSDEELIESLLDDLRTRLMTINCTNVDKTLADILRAVATARSSDKIYIKGKEN